MMGWKRELPLNQWAVCWYQNWCFSLGSSRRPARSVVGHGQGQRHMFECIDLSLFASGGEEIPQLVRRRIWNGRWTLRVEMLKQGVLPSNKWGSKTCFGVVPKFLVLFFFSLDQGWLYKESRESLWGCQDYHQGFEDLRPVLEDELSKDLP